MKSRTKPEMWVTPAASAQAQLMKLLLHLVVLLEDMGSDRSNRTGCQQDEARALWPLYAAGTFCTDFAAAIRTSPTCRTSDRMTC